MDTSITPNLHYIGGVKMSALQFGKCIISPSIVFLQTKLCFAFTNRKPVLPGRILTV